MKKLLIFLIVLLPGLLPVQATPIKSLRNRTIKELIIRYNPGQMRVPGKAFNIGINAILNDGESASTKGYLNGSLRWRNFRIHVDKGYFARGKIILNESSLYQKGKFVTVTIYRKKGNKKIKTQKIPLHYETEIEIITKPGFSRAPGSIIEVGIRKWYNNEKFQEIWNSWCHKIANEFTLSSTGAGYSQGELRIYDDPFAIKDHVVSLEVYLKKNPEIISDRLNF